MTKIRICPKCRKAKLKNATNVSGWLAPDMYECTECNYIGYLYLEVDSEDLKSQSDNEL